MGCGKWKWEKNGSGERIRYTFERNMKVDRMNINESEMKPAVPGGHEPLEVGARVTYLKHKDEKLN